MVAITIPRPVLAVAASAVGSYLIGEGMWQALEYLAKRAEDSYNKTMGSLQQQFVTYYNAVPPESHAYNQQPNFKWSISVGYSLVPSCPHPPKEVYFPGSYNPTIVCKADDQTCIDQRKKILTIQLAFENSRNMFLINGHEKKWTLTAVVIGVATALLSTTFILPKTASLAMRVGCVITGGFVGIAAADFSTMFRKSDSPLPLPYLEILNPDKAKRSQRVKEATQGFTLYNILIEAGKFPLVGIIPSAIQGTIATVHFLPSMISFLAMMTFRSAAFRFLSEENKRRFSQCLSFCTKQMVSSSLMLGASIPNILSLTYFNRNCLQKSP